MKIAVIQASSQKEKNALLYQCTARAVEKRGHEVLNFGVFPEEEAGYSYIETAFLVSLLLSSGAVDFAVTGCSSGQGMMLACNSLPGVLCGYVPTPQDAYLFGRINGGNAASLPLGLGFGWSGELNLQYTLDKLFDGDFGAGYPPQDAERKRRDTRLLKELNGITKRDMAACFHEYPPELVERALSRRNVTAYILANGAGWAVEMLRAQGLDGSLMEERPLRREDITENVIAIKVNHSYREGMSDLALYEITRGYWKVNKKRAEQADYAFSVYNGIIKEVYRILEWLPAGTVPRQTLPGAEAPAGRYEFRGEIAGEAARGKYVGRSMAGLYRNGEQNPIKYFYGNSKR